MIACGTLEELGQQISHDGINTVELSVYPDNVGLQSLLKNMKGIIDIEKNNDTYVIRSSYDLRRALSKTLAEQGYTIMHLRQAGSDLDEIYRKYFEKAGEKVG